MGYGGYRSRRGNRSDCGGGGMDGGRGVGGGSTAHTASSRWVDPEEELIGGGGGVESGAELLQLRQKSVQLTVR